MFRKRQKNITVGRLLLTEVKYSFLQPQYEKLCVFRRVRNTLSRSFFLTGVTFGLTAWNKFDALGAGAGVTAWSEQTQVAAGSLTRVLHCKHKKNIIIVLSVKTLKFRTYFILFRLVDFVDDS